MRLGLCVRLVNRCLLMLLFGVKDLFNASLLLLSEYVGRTVEHKLFIGGETENRQSNFSLPSVGPVNH